MDKGLQKMNSGKNKNEPVCRFGPGGDFVSEWPPQDLQAPQLSKKYVSKLFSSLNVIITALLGSELNTTSKENSEYVVETTAGEPAYSAPNTVAKSDSRFSGQSMLFPDDSRIGLADAHKPKHRIRAYHRAAKKRPAISFADQGSLFEADFKSAKTA